MSDVFAYSIKLCQHCQRDNPMGRDGALMEAIDKLSKTTITLHWVCAIAMVSMSGVGIYMASFQAWSLYPWHKSVGVILFVVLVARGVWRMWEGWPAPVDAPSRLERNVARIVHWTLLAASIALPVTGMIFSGASGHGFGTLGFEIVHAQHHPTLAGQVIAYSARWADLGQLLHAAIGYGLIALMALHIAGALKHHFLTGDRTLTRMLGKPDPLN